MCLIMSLTFAHSQTRTHTHSEQQIKFKITNSLLVANSFVISTAHVNAFNDYLASVSTMWVDYQVVRLIISLS